MTSRFIGVVVGQRTMKVYSIIDPTNEVELNRSTWLQMQGDDHETLQMVRVLRADYINATQLSDGLTALIEAKR